MTDPKDPRDDGRKPRRDTGGAIAGEVTRREHAAHEVAEPVQAADDARHEPAHRTPRSAQTRLSTVRDLVHDAEHDARVRLAQGAETIYGELDDGIDDARGLAEEALEAGRAAWTQASEAVHEVSRDAMSAARETFDDVGDQCRHYVREKPLRALAIAGAAGFVLALLLKPRR